MIAVATPDRRASGATATFARYERYGFEDGNGGGNALSGTHTCNVARSRCARAASRPSSAGGGVGSRLDDAGSPLIFRNFVSLFASSFPRAETKPVLTPPATAPSATSCIHCLARARA